MFRMCPGFFLSIPGELVPFPFSNRILLVESSIYHYCVEIRNQLKSTQTKLGSLETIELGTRKLVSQFTKKRLIAKNVFEIEFVTRSGTSSDVSIHAFSLSLPLRRWKIYIIFGKLIACEPILTIRHILSNLWIDQVPPTR